MMNRGKKKTAAKKKDVNLPAATDAKVLALVQQMMGIQSQINLMVEIVLDANDEDPKNWNFDMNTRALTRKADIKKPLAVQK